MRTTTKILLLSSCILTASCYAPAGHSQAASPTAHEKKEQYMIRADRELPAPPWTSSVAPQKNSGKDASRIEHETILQHEDDPSTLMQSAQFLAASSSEKDLVILGRYLRDAHFLRRLDGPENYQGTFARLRLAKVLTTLERNHQPAVEQLLLHLIDDAVFQGHVLRMQLLIHALSAIRPSPPQAVTYWDHLSQAESPIAYDVIDALCRNQSKPALLLLEQKFLDHRHNRHEKISWMRELIVPRRTDKPLLTLCEQMIRHSLPDDMRPFLVEVLFDYQPDQWYIDEYPPVPPPLHQADRQAKNILRKIATYAVKRLQLSARQKHAVQSALKEL